MLRAGRLSLGPWIDRFEQQFASACGAPYAAAVSSGTAGLHLLCHAAGLGPGRRGDHFADRVRGDGELLHLRGRDAGLRRRRPATLNLDPAAVEAAVTDRTKAIVAVDMFGYPCELDELRAIAERHGLALIDDSCEALGAEYKGAPIGSHGVSAVFGFYPNKQITTGEGGVVTTALRGRAGPCSSASATRALVREPLVPPRPPRLQLPLHRPPGGGRPRPAREARPDPRAARARRPRATRPRSPGSTGSRRRSPTMANTAAPGSSTCRSSTGGSTATA